MKTGLKKQTPVKKEAGTLQPRLKWQTGAYRRDADFRFLLPYQFLLLCKLAETPPETILNDFMANLACGSPGTRGSAAAQQALTEYFVQCGYGQARYSIADIRQIFREMDAMGMLFPKDASDKMLALHSRWRGKYQRYWFRKWRNKPCHQKKTENSFIIEHQ